MGFYLYRLRPDKIVEVSVIGVVLLFLSVFSGHFIPNSALAPFFNLPRNSLVAIIALYGFAASVLPVWMLLCPRDYISTYMKIGTVILLTLGVIIVAPNLQMPPLTKREKPGFLKS